MRLRVLAAHVVGVGGGDERDALVPRELRELGVHLDLLAHPVRLHLEEEGARLEDVPVLARRVRARVHVAVADEARHLAAEAGGEPDEALASARFRSGLSMRGS